MRADQAPKVHEPRGPEQRPSLFLHLSLSALSSPQQLLGQTAAPVGIRLPEPRKRTDILLCGTLASQDNSPPCDFELIDGAFAVVVVDEVLVTHPDTLVVHREALG